MKWIKVGFIVCAVVGVCYSARHFLATTLIQVVVESATHDKLKFARSSWERGVLVYENASIGEHRADLVEIEFHLDLLPFYFEPVVRIQGMSLAIDSEAKGGLPFAFLMPGPFMGLKASAAGDVRLTREKTSFPFIFQAGEATEEIGTLFIDDKVKATLSLHNNEKVRVAWDVFNAPIEELSRIASSFTSYNPLASSEISGVVSVHGVTEFDLELANPNLSLDIVLNDVLIENPARGISMKVEEGTLSCSYPIAFSGPVWQRVSMIGNLQKANLLFSKPLLFQEWALENATIDFNLDAANEPIIELHGEVVSEGRRIPLHSSSRGAIHEDLSFWLESEIAIGESEVGLSLCQTGDTEFYLKSDLRQVSDDFCMCVRPWSCFISPIGEEFSPLHGKISGRLAFWWKDGTMSKVQGEYIDFEDVYLEALHKPLQFFMGKAQGSFLFDKGLNSLDVSAEFSEGVYRLEHFDFLDAQGKIEIASNEFKKATVTGALWGSPFELEMNGFVHEPQLKAHMASYANEWSSLFSEELVHLFVTAGYAKGVWSGSGTLGASNELSFKGILNAEKVAVSLIGDNIKLPLASQRILFSLKESGNFSLRLKDLYWTADFNFEGGSFFDPKTNVCGQNLLGQVIASPGHWEVRSFEGESKNIRFSGQVDFDLAQREHCELRFVADKVEGSFSDLDYPFVPSALKKAQGQIEIAKNGCQLRWHEDDGIRDFDYRVVGKLSQAHLGAVRDLSCDFEYDSSVDIGCLRMLQAHIASKTIASQLVKYKSLSGHQLDFDLSVAGEGEKPMEISGSGRQTDGGIYKLNLIASDERKLLMAINGDQTFFTLRWDDKTIQGNLRQRPEDLLLNIESMKNLLPTPYEVSSLKPIFIQLEPFDLVGYHFAIRNQEQDVGSVRGSSLKEMKVEFKSDRKTLEADFSLSLNDRFIELASGPDRIQIAEGMRGRFRGLEFFKKGVNVGLKICDGDTAAQFFGAELFKGLKNIGLKGVLQDGAFDGVVEAHDGVINHVHMSHLKGDVTATAKEFCLRDLNLTDDAVKVGIKEIKGYEENGWNLSIPIVRIQNFRPGFLKIEGEGSDGEKPFAIRSGVLTNLSLKNGDLKTLAGEATFYFTNSVKKETTLFDAPARILKDLGLDLAVITPTYGEILCEFRDGKAVFTDVRQTYSDGKRAQFFLSKEPSFIDLTGELNINLSMKQDVVLKMAEPFVLKIRGTLQKPEYTLR